MLGRFLELSLATSDIRASVDFYERLGFSQVDVGEAWSHPYAVVTDGRLYVGLHQNLAFASSTTFVKPQLLKALPLLEGLGIEFEFRRLAGDTFNEIGWFDPAGNLLRLVEARTFSPSLRAPTAPSLCGYFLEVALAVTDVDAAKNAWETLGFVGFEEADGPLPHVACTSDSVTIGLYPAERLRGPALRFEVDDLAAARLSLDAAGMERDPPPKSLRHLPAVLLTAPEGTLILIMESA